MPLCLFRRSSSPESRLGLVDGSRVIDLGQAGGPSTMRDALAMPKASLREQVERARQARGGEIDVDAAQFSAPIDRQEVWAAGVTYLRSRDARMEESTQKNVYDLVYDAPRPELFLKATPNRVSGPGEEIAIRGDSTWDVPEPELVLAINADGEIVGFTVGNDVSSRSIEGENPLYLPQAKVYSRSAALGPTIALDWELPSIRGLTIQLTIEREGREHFRGETSTDQIHRPLEELVAYLRRGNAFPDGVFLMTGTGIIPPSEFTLQAGDHVAITIDRIGTLRNPVVRLDA